MKLAEIFDVNTIVVTECSFVEHNNSVKLIHGDETFTVDHLSTGLTVSGDLCNIMLAIKVCGMFVWYMLQTSGTFVLDGNDQHSTLWFNCLMLTRIRDQLESNGWKFSGVDNKMVMNK